MYHYYGEDSREAGRHTNQSAEFFQEVVGKLWTQIKDMLWETMRMKNMRQYNLCCLLGRGKFGKGKICGILKNGLF